MPGFNVRLEGSNILSATTRDFRFIRTDNKVVEFKPGQFFRFLFSDGRGEFERSYSLCNGDVDPGVDMAESSNLDLLISTVEGGRASELLFNCKQGLEAQVTGPFGRLLVPANLPRRLFLVATSVGIAPYMPMLNQLSPQLKSKGLGVHFLYGTRDEAEFVYGDQLVRFAKSHPGFELSVLG